MRRLLLALALVLMGGQAFAQVTVFPATGTADPAQFSSGDGSIVVAGVTGAVTLALDSSDIGHFSFGTGTVPANGIQGDSYFETDLVLPSWYVATNTPVTAVVLPGASGAPTDDSVPVGTGTAWAKEAIPDCDDANGQHLNRDTATNAWSCGTSNGGLATILANTGTASTTAAQSGYVYTNTGDADGSALNLLDNPTAGVAHSVVVTVAQTITVTPASGESLYLNAATCANVTSATVGAALSLAAVTGGSGAIWVASGAGWTCN